MDKYLFQPSRIINVDKTGVSCAHSNHLKVMSVKEKKKQMDKVTSGEENKELTNERRYFRY